MTEPIDLLARRLGHHDEHLAKARTLSEALPYMKRYAGCTFVVKYGGNAMGDDHARSLFARDIVLLKQVGINPVVVHGGGPQIGKMLDRLNIPTQFVDGLRVTDKESVDVVEMVLSGSINKQLVWSIQEAGGTAAGISGKDGALIRARKLRRSKRDPGSNIEKILDLGFVGEPSKVDPDILIDLIEADLIPVIAPIGAGSGTETFNINADTAAGAIAAALGATRFFLLTDVAGVMDKRGQLISTLTPAEARAAVADGTIAGGMIPKVETCLHAVKEGVSAAAILDGRVPHALLLEIFTSGGAGTLIGSPSDPS